MYDAVQRVDRYLTATSPTARSPRRARYPLNAFLFRDKFGYCQQFSGAMALMLRMAGIPARVAAGFAPGSFNRDSGEYRVRDLDAHSWVEVYFNGIGWVHVRPDAAPPRPAEAQAADLGAELATGGAINGSRAGAAAPDRTAPAAPSAPARRARAAARRRGCCCRCSCSAAPALVGLADRARAPRGSARRERGRGPARRAAPRAAPARLGGARRAPRCSASSAGSAAPPARPRRATRPRCARTATTRARPAAPSLRDRRVLRRDLTARAGLRGRAGRA